MDDLDLLGDLIQMIITMVNYFLFLIKKLMILGGN